MKKLLALTVIAMMAFSVSAMAQVDPDPDGMGIYFDLGATQFMKTYNVPFEALNCYLLLTRASGSQVLAWEARIVETNNFTAAGAWAANGGIDADPDANDFAMGLGLTPLPAGPDHTAVLLASKTMYGLPGQTATFAVMGIPGSLSFPLGDPGYSHTLGIKTPCQVPTGDMLSPQACVNTSCIIVSNEDLSWSQMKALY